MEIPAFSQSTCRIKTKTIFTLIIVKTKKVVYALFIAVLGLHLLQSHQLKYRQYLSLLPMTRFPLILFIISTSITTKRFPEKLHPVFSKPYKYLLNKIPQYLRL